MHFIARRGDTGEVLDSSRSLALGPFELRIGKKFVLAVWEAAVKTMRLQEVSVFRCAAKVGGIFLRRSRLKWRHVALLTFPPCWTTKDCKGYVQLATILRQEAHRKRHPGEHNEHYGHSCAHGHSQLAENQDLQGLEGVGLDFEIELVRVEVEGSFEKESWELSMEERIASVSALRVSSILMCVVWNWRSCLVDVLPPFSFHAGGLLT